MADRLQHRRDTAARWAEVNPVLLEGEIGYVLDNPNQHKIGDGEHAWNDLPLRGFTGTISQELGNDENAVVSQKVVTEAINNEKTRAKAAEQGLSDRIDNLVINGGGGGSTEVLDLLTSPSKTAALSANQGRVLNEKITELENNMSSTNEGVYESLNDHSERIEQNAEEINNIKETISESSVTIVQETGASTTDVMSQKAVTDAIAAEKERAERIEGNLSDSIGSLGNTISSIGSELINEKTRAEAAEKGLSDRIDNLVINGGGGGSTEVIDNLTSTSTTAALSANQGKVLDEKIEQAVNTIPIPDEEDVTKTEEGKLKFANRGNENGLGYVILRANKTFAEQVTKENTIYEIRYDFELPFVTKEISLALDVLCIVKDKAGEYYRNSTWNQGRKNETVTVPKGCILVTEEDEDGECHVISEDNSYTFTEQMWYFVAGEYSQGISQGDRVTVQLELGNRIPANCIFKFNGGKLKNGTISTNNVQVGNYDVLRIDADAYQIFDNVEIDGCISSDKIYVEWFGAKGDYKTDNTEALRYAIKTMNGKGNTLYLKENGIYTITGAINHYDDKNHSLDAIRITSSASNIDKYPAFSDRPACIRFGEKGIALFAGDEKAENDGEYKEISMSIVLDNIKICGTWGNWVEDDCKVFSNCVLLGTRIERCHFSYIYCMFYKTGIWGVSKICDNTFYGVYNFSFADTQEAGRKVSLVDSFIQRNYINGGAPAESKLTSIDNVFFDWREFNGATLSDNFIDYYCTMYNRGYFTVISLNNTYQVFKYFHKNCDIYSRFDRFSHNDPSFVDIEEVMRRYANMSYIGGDGGNYTVPPYIASDRYAKRNVVFEDMILEHHVRNVIYRTGFTDGGTTGNKFIVDVHDADNTIYYRTNAIVYPEGSAYPVNANVQQSNEIYIDRTFVKATSAMPVLSDYYNGGKSKIGIGECILCDGILYKLTVNDDYEVTIEKYTPDWVQRTVNTESADVDGCVRKKLSKEIYVGENLISGVVGTGTNWTHSGGRYTHATGSAEPLEFDFATEEGERYIAVMYVGTSVFAEQYVNVSIGDGELCDIYKGITGPYYIGMVSDGGKLKVTPNSNFSNAVYGIELRKIVAKEDADLTITFSSLNVNINDGDDITGFWNVAVGPTNTLGKLQNGSRNVSIGMNCMSEMVSGERNIGIGTFALNQLRHGIRNVAIGADALYRTMHSNDNVAIGKGAAGYTHSDAAAHQYEQNVAIGTEALGANATKYNRNTAVGYRAAFGSVSAERNDNTAVGCEAGYYGGSGNTAVGSKAGRFSKGNYNVFIGSETGDVTETGDGNIFIGYQAKVLADGTWQNQATHNNSIVIGNKAKGNKSNQVVIGNKSQTELVLLGNKLIKFNEDGTVTWESITI